MISGSVCMGVPAAGHVSAGGCTGVLRVEAEGMEGVLHDSECRYGFVFLTAWFGAGAGSGMQENREEDGFRSHCLKKDGEV